VPLSEFQAQCTVHRAKPATIGPPRLLTIKGEPRLVVQAAESLRAMMERVERAATIEGLRKVWKRSRRGEGVPALEALEAMRKKHGLPRPR
jgi:hypothetical protein